MRVLFLALRRFRGRNVLKLEYAVQHKHHWDFTENYMYYLKIIYTASL